MKIILWPRKLIFLLEWFCNIYVKTSRDGLFELENSEFFFKPKFWPFFEEPVHLLCVFSHFFIRRFLYLNWMFLSFIVCLGKGWNLFLPFLDNWASPHFLIDFDRHQNFCGSPSLKTCQIQWNFVWTRILWLKPTFVRIFDDIGWGLGKFLMNR